MLYSDVIAVCSTKTKEAEMRYRYTVWTVPVPSLTLPLHSMNSSGTFINTTYRHQFTVHEADLSSRHSNDIPFLLHSPLLIHTICQLLLATAMIYKLTFITFN